MKSFDNRRGEQSRTQDALKRGFDILLAGSGLILSSPVWLMAMAAIAAEDGLPVFFRQSRWGKGGRTFSALKFRSMRKGSEKERSVQAGQEDPRITRVGRFLRACAMDELPQLWNIFVGDMSFVGPRALPINEIQSSESNNDVPDEAIPGFSERLAVRPGLTGIAQIYADRDTTRARKFRYDLLYIRRQSFWLDMRLIFLSFYISFRGRWEVRGDKFERQ
ncbi:MAG: sugar transferase [Acidobacteria bacterium]|nr:sugar transferase [Acidobacteriota bacterium]